MGIGVPGFVKSGVDIVKSGAGKVKDLGEKGLDKAKDLGGKGLDKAKDLGGKGLDKAKDLGGKGLDKAKDLGEKGLDKAKDATDDVVELSKDALDVAKKGVEFGARADGWVKEQQANFGMGVVEWGKSSVKTVADIVTHPVETLKAVDKLYHNPALNPMQGIPKAIAQGKNPVEAYKEGWSDLKDIGTGLADDYKKVYQEHGAAGVAGYVAPDLAMAVLSSGSSAAGKGAATAGGKAVAKEVTEEVVEESVKDSVSKQVVKDLSKEAAKEVAPGPEDIVDKTRQQDSGSQQSYIDALLSSFSFF